MPTTDTLALARGAGLVAAINPCGFALLPAYLSLFVLDSQPSRTVAVLRAVKATTALTLGFAGVFAVFGLVVAPVASAVQAYLPVFTVVLGVAVALARTTMIDRARAAGGWLPRLGGALLLVAGGYVAWYGAWELRVLHRGAGADPIVSAAEHVQPGLAGLAETVGAFGFAVAIVVLVAVGLALGRRSGRASAGTTRTGAEDAQTGTEERSR